MDSIIRDLTDSAMKLVRQQEIAKNRARAEDAAEERILMLYLQQKSVGEVETMIVTAVLAKRSVKIT